MFYDPIQDVLEGCCCEKAAAKLKKHREKYPDWYKFWGPTAHDPKKQYPVFATPSPIAEELSPEEAQKKLQRIEKRRKEARARERLWLKHTSGRMLKGSLGGAVAGYALADLSNRVSPHPNPRRRISRTGSALIGAGLGGIIGRETGRGNYEAALKRRHAKARKKKRKLREGEDFDKYTPWTTGAGLAAGTGHAAYKELKNLKALRHGSWADRKSAAKRVLAGGFKGGLIGMAPGVVLDVGRDIRRSPKSKKRRSRHLRESAASTGAALGGLLGLAGAFHPDSRGRSIKDRAMMVAGSSAVGGVAGTGIDYLSHRASRPQRRRPRKRKRGSIRESAAQRRMLRESHPWIDRALHVAKRSGQGALVAGLGGGLIGLKRGAQTYQHSLGRELKGARRPTRMNTLWQFTKTHAIGGAKAGALGGGLYGLAGQ